MTAALPGRQEIMLERLREADGWYLPADVSERATLANLFKRGLVERSPRAAGYEYRLAAPELDLGAFGAQVVPLR